MVSRLERFPLYTHTVHYAAYMYYTGYSPGGNTAHLAPEILNAKPGPKRFLDYSKQAVWAAGVLAYELAGQ